MDRKNDVTYITIFQRHFKWHCNKHLRNIPLHSVCINTLQVDVNRIELFFKAAVISTHLIVLRMLGVLCWLLATLCNDGQILNIA